MMKKVISVLLALVLTLSLASVALAEGKIGVAMPTQSLQRWNQDGENMKKQLEDAGFTVNLQYANNEVATQVSQLENMILDECQLLVVASIDGSALGTVLAQAKEANIPVIAYDRLIMDTDAISYYTTFDNYSVGTIQGNYVKDTLDLDNAEGPFNMEFFAGSPDDNNARFFFQGAFDVLKPYIDSGKLVVKSGQVEFEAIATPSWSSEKAQARMDNLIAANYADGTKLDVVLCSNDSTALGATNSLVAAGFETLPIITGMDCDVANVKNMVKGLQSMSVFKDTRTLAAETVKMVTAIMKGETPETNNTYDNNVFKVPSYLCVPVFADASNYEELLVKSGYYTAEQLAQ
ncbi:MAG: sugar ABC transporter substrate-binding protein [Clostridia bacterium]